nr:hypothetical protein [Dyella sp. ASV24]
MLINKMKGSAMTASEWAAWVQAIGSIAAIGVAIWVPYRLAAKAANVREAEDHRKAMAMGLAVRFELQRIKWPLTRILNQWPEGTGAPMMIDLGEGGRREIFEEFKFPKGIAEHYARFHELGEAADDALLATAHAEDVSQLLTTIEIDLMHSGGDNQATLEKQLRSKIVSSLKHTNRAISLINALYVKP